MVRLLRPVWKAGLGYERRTVQRIFSCTAMPAVLLSTAIGVRLVFMSSELQYPGLPIKTPKHGNLMTFPRGLRDAIPDMPTCVGRVLELSSMTGDAMLTFWGGRQVHLDLLVKETGKLKG